MEGKFTNFHWMIWGILFLCLPQTALTQVASRDDSLACKLLLFSEAVHQPNVSYEKSLELFLRIRISIDTLESRGFSDLTFLSIIPLYSHLTDSVRFFTPSLFRDEEEGGYIIAIDENSKPIYRIRGFYLNDVEILFWRGWKRKKISKRQFLNSYYIEGIDLACLFQVCKRKSYDRDKYPCVKCYIYSNVIH